MMGSESAIKEITYDHFMAIIEEFDVLLIILK